MTDSEAAGLLGVAYTALLELSRGPSPRYEMPFALALIRAQIAFLRNQSPEDVQREFEK